MATETPVSKPDTIVLIHGLWMTPRSWEHWIEHFQKRGYTVLAPAYPGLDVEVEELRRDPSPIESLTIEEVAHHYETIIRGLDKPPILMGHSFGGALVQVLLDRGVGAAGVAIDSVPVKGVLLLPFTTIKATWPVLSHPSNRHKAVPFTHEQFHYAFTNTLSEEASRAAYDRYYIPAPGRFVFDGALANFNPHAATKVDFEKLDRAPLLFIAGGADNIMPASVNHSNARHYNTGIVDYKEYPERSHFTVGMDGWEEVADYALDWAESHANQKVAHPAIAEAEPA